MDGQIISVIMWGRDAASCSVGFLLLYLHQKALAVCLLKSLIYDPVAMGSMQNEKKT